MAKKGKSKISKVKRNNQTTNKMKKQGKLNLQRHRTKIQKQNPVAQQAAEYEHDSDSPSEEEWADMLDDEEKQYILSRIAKQPQLLSDVPEKDEKTKTRKRKREHKEKMPKSKKTASDSGAESEGSDSDNEVEDKYEQEMSEKPVKRIRPLLPIKTKEGLMERTEEVDFSDSEAEEEIAPPTKVTTDTDATSDTDSGMEGTGDDNEEAVEETSDQDGHVVSAVELMAARRDRLQHEKLRIGALCSSLLETPERKLKNLYPILYLMEERLKDGTLNLHSVRKIATISAMEVFKDILPDYQIRHQDYENVKLKKDTLALYKHEKELLEFYKRYLQRLEKATNALRSKKGDTRKIDEATTSIAVISVRCLCGMLVARPQFNYATNIAQSVAPLLDCRLEEVRNTVTEAFVNVFNDDQRGDITLAIVRLMNQLAKRRGERLQPDALRCLLALRIRDVDLDEQADLRHKKKQDEKHKKRIVNLSKKEKKRAKKLKEVERELLETEAQESSLARKKQLTEVTKTVFHIYFRLLKTAPGSKLLPAVLQGLSKFTHVINLEFYSDLVAILARLMSSGSLGLRERLLCVKTVLSVLSGAGDALNVDPATFYHCLYADVLMCHAGGSHGECRVVVEALQQLGVRGRRASAAVLAAFTKRLLTFAAAAAHNAALAALAIARDLIQQCKPLSSLLEPDSEAGGGRYQPELLSAEHCGALAAAAHELTVLQRHYHPEVRAAAKGLLATWPHNLTNVSPVSLFDSYDGTQMALKPAVPPPQPHSTPKLKSLHNWAQKSLQQHCETVEEEVELVIKDKIVQR